MYPQSNYMDGYPPSSNYGYGNNHNGGYPPESYDRALPPPQNGGRPPLKQQQKYVQANNPSVGPGPTSFQMPDSPAGYAMGGGYPPQGGPPPDVGGFYMPDMMGSGGGNSGFGGPSLPPPSRNGGFGGGPGYPPSSGFGMGGSGYPPVGGGYPPAGGPPGGPPRGGGYPPVSGPPGGGYPPGSGFGGPSMGGRPNMSNGPNMSGRPNMGGGPRPPMQNGGRPGFGPGSGPRPNNSRPPSNSSSASMQSRPQPTPQRTQGLGAGGEGLAPRPPGMQARPTSGPSPSMYKPMGEGLSWKQGNKQHAPAGAIQAGTHKSEAFYIGRAKYKDSLQVGMVSAIHGGLLIPYDGKAVLLTEYEVLCGPVDKVKWVPMTGKLSKDKLKEGGATPLHCGNEKKGEPIYAARVTKHAKDYGAKVSLKSKGALFPYHGAESSSKEYLVLCEK